jgi:hypothetical protein
MQSSGRGHAHIAAIAGMLLPWLACSPAAADPVLGRVLINAQIAATPLVSKNCSREWFDTATARGC